MPNAIATPASIVAIELPDVYGNIATPPIVDATPDPLPYIKFSFEDYY